MTTPQLHLKQHTDHTAKLKRSLHMDPSHPPVTNTHAVCASVSRVVSRRFLAGVRWESAHVERGGHPDEAWRRKNECDDGAQ